jgi:hypothetical protein
MGPRLRGDDESTERIARLDRAIVRQAASLRST